ncbi:MAG: zf-TFIIB domain-containing protein [Acidimicrobiia bacterium]
MKCPSDGTTLVMTERQGVEIDYCPDCRGVWLDRGELDKIAQRMDSDDDDGDDRDDRDRDRDYRDRDRDDRGRDHREREHREGSYRAPHKKKKKSLFSEMFESFGGGE